MNGEIKELIDTLNIQAEFRVLTVTGIRKAENDIISLKSEVKELRTIINRILIFLAASGAAGASITGLLKIIP